MSYNHTAFYYKCECGKWVKCNFANECEKQCKDLCTTSGGHDPFIENSIGPPRDNYPPIVQSLYDLIPTNQPDEYNYEVAIGNPIHYSSQTQGLSQDAVDYDTGFARR